MVRTIRKSSIIFCFITFFAFAGNDEELFLRANKLYELHEYDKALSLYEMIPSKGRAVLYNMGNCYFHKNDYSQALIYWMRAEKGAGSGEYAAISHNKNYVLQKMGKKEDEHFLSRVKHFFDNAEPYISLFCLQLLFLLLWYFCIFFGYRYGRIKKIQLLLLMMSLFFIATMLWMQHLKKSTIVGVVTQKKAELLAGPDKGFDLIGFVNYADHIIIKETRKGWYKVRYSDNIGWVEADAIQII